MTDPASGDSPTDARSDVGDERLVTDDVCDTGAAAGGRLMTDGGRDTAARDGERLVADGGFGGTSDDERAEASIDRSEEPLVRIRNLQKYYDADNSVFDQLFGSETAPVKAVDGIDLDVYRGETIGLVGESGCGKSTTGETVLRLREATGGTVEFDGRDVLSMDDDELQSFRERAQIVFQDPFSSLDPRMTVGDIVTEGLKIHDLPEEPPADGRSKREWRVDRAEELLERVGLSADQYDRYPHEFSGGQRQRIGIARALALDPEFVVLDEPVSALDVSVQAQILNLLADLQEEYGLTYLFIAHDLSVVRHICDRVAVMYLGEIVELGSAEAVFDSPRHPYTEALLESVPRADTSEQGRRVEPLAGDVPSPRNPPSGCRFRTRCPQVISPAGVDIEQADYRAVVTFRDRLRRGELGTERFRGDGDEAFKDAVREEFDLGGVTGADRDTVEDALEILANGRPDAAAERLTDRFESVCETDEPTAHGESHTAACHLYREDLRDEPIDDVESVLTDAAPGDAPFESGDGEARAGDSGASGGDD